MSGPVSARYKINLVSWPKNLKFAHDYSVESEVIIKSYDKSNLD